MDEISRTLENPLTTLWSLTLQENYSIIEGDAIEGSEWGNNLFFQPALPVPIGKNQDKVLIIRPDLILNIYLIIHLNIKWVIPNVEYM